MASGPSGVGAPGEAHGQRLRTPAPRSCRQRFRLARSLLLTPWFAAGAGIVIAAAVAVGSPAALTYSPSGPGVRCTESGCASTPAPERPGVATASPGVALEVGGRHPHGAAARSGPPRAAKPGGGAVYQLGYQIIRDRRHRFVALITMPSDLASGSWSLAFGFPSARVDHVLGAQWQPSGNGEGGTALGSTRWSGGPLGWPDAGQLVVLASGAPTVPSSCTLNGVNCSFG